MHWQTTAHIPGMACIAIFNGIREDQKINIFSGKGAIAVIVFDTVGGPMKLADAK